MLPGTLIPWYFNSYFDLDSENKEEFFKNLIEKISDNKLIEKYNNWGEFTRNFSLSIEASSNITWLCTNLDSKISFSNNEWKAIIELSNPKELE